MPNHVTIDTARKLQKAGWQHTLEPGDWVLWQGKEWLVMSQPRGRTQWVYLSRYDDDNGWVDDADSPAADCLHLPSSGQLLDRLTQIGRAVDAYYLHRQWRVVGFARQPEKDVSGRLNLSGEHESLAEAAALAWLASREAAE